MRATSRRDDDPEGWMAIQPDEIRSVAVRGASRFAHNAIGRSKRFYTWLQNAEGTLDRKGSAFLQNAEVKGKGRKGIRVLSYPILMP